MSAENPFSGGVAVGNLGAEFESIVQAGLDPTYVDGPAAEQTVPYGQFTPEVGDVDVTRAPMATSTGYTGNNSEESA
ncbi:MAG TPA: hypothetical protein VL737_05370 [Candidatus Pristimantibacillus sp.]|nr:hypothetical protein [Candidatus Pristimantibacillus sp.]